MFRKILRSRKKWFVFPILGLGVISLIIVLISVWRLMFDTSNKPVFVKVKVSQGLWWASTQSPGIWMMRGLKVGEKEVSLFGRPQAEIIKVSYYPSVTSSFRSVTEYSIYVTLKINVERDGKGLMVFKRSPVSVGSPIEIQFPSGALSGNIIQVIDGVPEEEYVTKNIVLMKRGAYPWEYSGILVGEKQTDGNDIVFEVLNKRALDTNTLGIDPYGNISPNDRRKYIQVNATIKVKEENDQFIFGEEQVVRAGYPLVVATQGYFFDNFVVEKIY